MFATFCNKRTITFTMSEILPGIVPQPDFPKSDLTDENAAIIEHLLSDEYMVEETHRQAEQNVMLYKVAHTALMKIGKDGIDNTSHLAGLDAGMRLHESIATLVRLHPPHYDQHTVVHRTGRLLAVSEFKSPLMMFSDAQDEFAQTHPRTTEVLHSLINRRDRRMGQAAIMGAAIEQQIELDVEEFSMFESLYNEER